MIVIWGENNYYIFTGDVNFIFPEIA